MCLQHCLAPTPMNVVDYWSQFHSQHKKIKCHPMCVWPGGDLYTHSINTFDCVGNPTYIHICTHILMCIVLIS